MSQSSNYPTWTEIAEKECQRLFRKQASTPTLRREIESITGYDGTNGSGVAVGLHHVYSRYLAGARENSPACTCQS